MPDFMPLPDYLQGVAVTLVQILLAVLVLLLLRARWIWRQGYRAGYADRGRDAQAELREEWENGYRWGQWHPRQKENPS